MGGIFGLIIFIFDIIAIVECLKSKAETSKKILWVLLVFFLPLIGIVLYYLIGRKEFKA
jgi:hypothetical protein